MVKPGEKPDEIRYMHPPQQMKKKDDNLSYMMQQTVDLELVQKKAVINMGELGDLLEDLQKTFVKFESDYTSKYYDEFENLDTNKNELVLDVNQEELMEKIGDMIK